jgi:putative flippase GtrA
VRNTLRLPRQALRFCLVGGLNTLLDLLILNGLLWLFPTTSSLVLLVFNAVAYSFGAVNSFVLNKYWTFERRQRTTPRELGRFALTTLVGIAWSSGILWLASNMLHPLLINPTLWANASKVFAIGGTTIISFLGMRLWVFIHHPPLGKPSHYEERRNPTGALKFAPTHQQPL